MPAKSLKSFPNSGKLNLILLICLFSNILFAAGSKSVTISLPAFTMLFIAALDLVTTESVN